MDNYPPNYRLFRVLSVFFDFEKGGTFSGDPLFWIPQVALGGPTQARQLKNRFQARLRSVPGTKHSKVLHPGSYLRVLRSDKTFQILFRGYTIF